MTNSNPSNKHPGKNLTNIIRVMRNIGFTTSPDRTTITPETVYFIRSASWLYYILGNLSCIFLYMIFYFILSILIDLHSKKWIKIYLFQLVVKCIKTYILVPNLSISHIFLSIIKFLLLFITLREALQFKYPTL